MTYNDKMERWRIGGFRFSIFPLAMIRYEKQQID